MFPLGNDSKYSTQMPKLMLRQVETLSFYMEGIVPGALFPITPSLRDF